jgi:hypothetical protein
MTRHCYSLKYLVTNRNVFCTATVNDPILLGIGLLCEKGITVDLKNGNLCTEEGGEHENYPIWPQLTKSAFEAVQPLSHCYRK